MRFLLFIHRYLGVAVGLLMTLWCLSGFVMMYQSFPSVSEEQRLAGLSSLDLANCCHLPDLEVENSAPAPGFRIEMLLGEPVLKLARGVRQPGGNGEVVNMLKLRTGQAVPALNEAQVLEVAQTYGKGNAIKGEPHSQGLISIDQWTIQTARRNQPAYHIAFDDEAATEIYVSGKSGEVFQATDRRTRVLGWLGAIPHWLYPTMLRQNGQLWSQIVIWTSIAGTFLTVTGLYVGITSLRRSTRDGSLRSPYGGWWYWHHITGLIFGVLTLTWVFSGLMMMNPWGALTGGGLGGDYRARIIGTASWDEAKVFIASLNRFDAKNIKQLQAAPFNGRLHVLAQRQEGKPLRLDTEARLAQLTDSEVQRALAKLEVPILESSLMATEDNYYYTHKEAVDLPIYRVLIDDAETTRLYVDATTGSFHSVGATARANRWIDGGMHGLDLPGLHTRPLWDIVTILLLTGVTLLCAIGSWLSLKRIALDFRKLRRR